MNISFRPLVESDFPLLLAWLESPHVKKWWERDVTYTPGLVKEKYRTYVKGYKHGDGKHRPIYAFIIYSDATPIGYIQYYNAYDFSREGYKITNLPQSLAAIDMFIGEEGYINKGMGQKALELFLNGQVCKNFDYAFVDPKTDNLAAVKTYEKAGFRKLLSNKGVDVIWMLRENILEVLKSREPIFHHPEKFGTRRADIENQMCDGFWEVGASGNIYTKQDIVDALLERYTDPNYQDNWETSDFKLTRIEANSYLLTYTLVQNKTRRTRRATIWQRINDQWKILYHQGTIVDQRNT